MSWLGSTNGSADSWPGGKDPFRRTAAVLRTEAQSTRIWKETRRERSRNSWPAYRMSDYSFAQLRNLILRQFFSAQVEVSTGNP